MALIMVAVGAGGLVCWFVAALLLPRRSIRSSSSRVSEPRNPSREEDLVRPAVSASGERTWIQPNETVWHEIVTWPATGPAADKAEAERRPA